MLGFENALTAIKMIKDQIQCGPQSLLNFRHTEYRSINSTTPPKEYFSVLRNLLLCEGSGEKVKEQKVNIMNYTGLTSSINPNSAAI